MPPQKKTAWATIVTGIRGAKISRQNHHYHIHHQHNTNHKCGISKLTVVLCLLGIVLTFVHIQLELAASVWFQSTTMETRHEQQQQPQPKRQSMAQQPQSKRHQSQPRRDQAQQQPLVAVPASKTRSNNNHHQKENKNDDDPNRNREANLRDLIPIKAIQKTTKKDNASSTATATRNSNKIPSFQSSLTSSSSSSCAINLFGLPRAFASLVLPSLTKHVIQTNPTCDYFVHYYNLTQEVKGRSSTTGGAVHAEQVYLLTQAVQSVNPHAVIQYAVTQEEEFWTVYRDLLDRIHTTKDEKGRYLYHPWKAKTYQYPTTMDNIIKMWHSIQAAWTLMEQHGREKQQKRSDNNNQENKDSPPYDRVAMMRLDVVYMTPIRLWEVKLPAAPKNTTSGGAAVLADTDSNDPLVLDVENKVAVIPSFARFPVNDRLIYGPYHAVEQWAAHRFDRMQAHVEWIRDHNPGWGLHSERFIQYAILPSIQALGYRIWQHDSLCFFRARVDESLWITDCWAAWPDNANPHVVTATFGSATAAALAHVPPRLAIRPLEQAAQRIVERVLARPCMPGNITRVRKLVSALHCRRPPPQQQAYTAPSQEEVEEQ
ncbi:hypothetical protein ACA910_018025 [Epithemia clementina (nom. ined.)]